MTKSGLLLSVMMIMSSGWDAPAASSGVTVLNQSNVTNQSKADQLGAGIQIGSLSGVNFEYWADSNRTFNGAMTFARGNTAVTFATLWMFRDALKGSASNFVPFIGAGVLAVWGNRDDYFSRRSSESFVLAAQVPMGIQFLPHQERFGLFVEFSPSLEIVPATYGFITGDIGARYYF